MARARPDRSEFFRNPDGDPRGPWMATDITSHSSPEARPRMAYEINGHLPPSGRTWRFSRERMEALVQAGRIILRPGRRPLLKRYLDEAANVLPPVPPPDQQPPDSPAGPRGAFILRTAMRELAMDVARYPSQLRELEWRDLERVLREVFEGLGYATILTRSTKDGGFDLEVKYPGEDGEETYLIEVKHWTVGSNRPGNKVITDFFDVVVAHKEASGGVLLSSSGFVAGAAKGRTEVERKVIRMGDGNKIVSLCQNYLASASGLWTPTTDLADMLLTGTL